MMEVLHLNPMFMFLKLANEYKGKDCNPKYERQSINRSEKYRKKGYGFSGNIYVIISVYTYSSAMDFAMLIKDNNIGTIIGEASSNNPNSYGMITRFVLPNSKLYAQISTKKWYRINETTEEKFIEPDIKCESEQAILKLYDKIKSTSEN